MICGICKRDMPTVRVIDAKFHCSDCEYELLGLPQLMVARSWGYGGMHIFDSVTKRVVRGGLKTLEKCDFVLYNHKHFLKSCIKYLYQDEYILRYFGTKKCKRFPKVTWPVNFVPCDGKDCKFI